MLVDENKKIENKGFSSETIGIQIPSTKNIDETIIYDMSLINGLKMKFKEWKTGWKEQHLRSGDEFDDENYIDSILELCIKKEIKLVIPTIDTELLILSRAIKLFLLNKIQIVISDFDLITKCRDKRQTNFLFEALKITIPRVIDKSNPSFPLFIKPYDGSLSKDIFIINYNLQNLIYNLLSLLVNVL